VRTRVCGGYCYSLPSRERDLEIGNREICRQFASDFYFLVSEIGSGAHPLPPPPERAAESRAVIPHLGPELAMGPYDSGGNRLGHLRVVIPMARNTSNVQRDTGLQTPALASAQIIQFSPYLAQKQEQERFLARLNRHSPPMVEGDIRAWVAAIVEWSARY